METGNRSPTTEPARGISSSSPQATHSTDDGVDLSELAAALTQAITTAGAMLKDRGATLWGGGEWRMTVIDESGKTVCLLRFSAE